MVFVNVESLFIGGDSHIKPQDGDNWVFAKLFY